MKKKLLVLLFSIIFSFGFIYADEALTEENNINEEVQQTTYSSTYNDGSIRNEFDDLAVHKKKITITSSNRDNILNTPYVDYKLKIYDYAEILSEEDERQIKALIDGYIEHTNMDLVFVTINMPYTYDEKNENYAADFYDYNDFGLDFDKYSGVLLLRNAYNTDPYYYIFTSGEAQLYYDDDRIESMLGNIYSDFSSGNYLRGFAIFASDITRYYDSGKALTDYYVDDMGYIHRDKSSFKIPYATAIIVGFVVSGIVLLVLIKKNKMVKKANEANDYLDKSSVHYNKKTDRFVNTVTTRHRISSDSGGSFGSHSGSSGLGHGGGGRHG